MIEWIKKHKKLIVLFFLFICIGIPFIIHCLFKIYPSEEYSFFIAEWGAGELLQYYGGVLAFLGTVVLGALSLYQNDIIRRESDKRIESQEKRERDANMPRFRVKFVSCSGMLSDMKVKIENISENVANDVLVYNICVVKDKDVIWKYSNALRREVIKPNDELLVDLGTESVVEKQISIQFDFKCNDKYGDEHRYHVYGYCENNNSTPYFKLKELVDEKQIC